ncbi:hypothetical protein [Bacillus paramycoides]|uniref:hypothetical protein n=1 Tax=Bacillus paramycoides TaxID=2026194 RepID=UPI000AC1B918
MYYNGHSDKQVTADEKRDVKQKNEEVKNENIALSDNEVKKDLIAYAGLIESGANEKESVAEGLKGYFVDADHDEAYNSEDVNIHARNIRENTAISGYNQKVEISLTSNVREGGSSSTTEQSTIKTANIVIAVGNKLYRNPMVNAGSGMEALIFQGN